MRIKVEYSIKPLTFVGKLVKFFLFKGKALEGSEARIVLKFTPLDEETRTRIPYLPLLSHTVWIFLPLIMKQI